MSAVSASLACALVEKTLRIAGRRKDFSGDRQELVSLIDAAQQASARLARFADEDAAAFEQYLAAKRQKDAAAIDDALRLAIEIPLQIAREAIGALDLCPAAAGFIHQAVTPDLKAAVILLAGAARATLLSVDANLAQIPAGTEFHRNVLAERQTLQRQATQKSNAP